MIFALLIAISFLFLLLPLINPKVPEEISQQAMNVAIYQDRLRTLEDDLKIGQLSEDQFTQAKADLDKELLSDTHQGDMVFKTPGPGLGFSNLALMVFLTFSIPMTTYILYDLWGNADKVQNITIAQKTPQFRQQPQQQAKLPSIEAMVDKLAARLKTNPNDAEGWVMLARSYTVTKQYQAALEAYQRAHELLGEDPDLLTSTADVAAEINNGSFAGQPEDMIKRALAVDPEHPKALLLTGFVLMEKNDFNSAIATWTHLKTVVADKPKWLTSVNQYIAIANEKMAAAPTLTADQPTTKTDAENSTGLDVQVDITAAIKQQLDPNATVYIFAKAVTGPQMPLAVIKTTVSALPGRFQLSDAQAMTPQFSLSKFPRVKLTARVSLSGAPGLKPGDYFSNTVTLANNTTDLTQLLIQEKMGTPPTPAAPIPTAAVSAGLNVHVSINDTIKQQIAPDSTVYIFAKAVNGPPMPLAVIKTTVDALPGRFQLSDAQAMTPQFSISKFSEVKLTARVSLSGTPGLKSGDYFSNTTVVANSATDTTKLVIQEKHTP